MMKLTNIITEAPSKKSAEYTVKNSSSDGKKFSKKEYEALAMAASSLLVKNGTRDKKQDFEGWKRNSKYLSSKYIWFVDDDQLSSNKKSQYDYYVGHANKFKGNATPFLTKNGAKFYHFKDYEKLKNVAVHVDPTKSEYKLNGFEVPLRDLWPGVSFGPEVEKLMNIITGGNDVLLQPGDINYTPNYSDSRKPYDLFVYGSVLAFLEVYKRAGFKRFGMSGVYNRGVRDTLKDAVSTGNLIKYHEMLSRNVNLFKSLRDAYIKKGYEDSDTTPCRTILYKKLGFKKIGDLFQKKFLPDHWILWCSAWQFDEDTFSKGSNTWDTCYGVLVDKIDVVEGKWPSLCEPTQTNKHRLKKIEKAAEAKRKADQEAEAEKEPKDTKVAKYPKLDEDEFLIVKAWQGKTNTYSNLGDSQYSLDFHVQDRYGNTPTIATLKKYFGIGRFKWYATGKTWYPDGGDGSNKFYMKPYKDGTLYTPAEYMMYGNDPYWLPTKSWSKIKKWATNIGNGKMKISPDVRSIPSKSSSSSMSNIGNRANQNIFSPINKM